MSLDSQSLLWKLDFNRFLIVTFLLFLHYSHLGGIRFQKDLLKLPPQNPICKYTCNWIFNMYRHRCSPLYAKQSQLTSLRMATRPHCRVQVTDSCNTERGRKIEAIIQLFRLKVTWSEYWIWDRPSNNLSIGTELWISRLNLDLNFIGRNLSRKYRYFPDP